LELPYDTYDPAIVFLRKFKATGLFIVLINIPLHKPNNHPSFLIAMEKSSNQNSDIAIIGISCMTAGTNEPPAIFGAMSWTAYVPSPIFPPEGGTLSGFYSKNHRDRDKICSKKAGFIPAIAFNPLDYGHASDQVSSTERCNFCRLKR